MQLRTLFTTLALGAISLTTTPTHAQAVTPCEVYLCMAGISGYGTSGGPACTTSYTYWHTALAVYSPYFNPPASAARRRAYLLSCRPGATVASNAAVLNTIMNTWGWIP